jgi:ATP-binding cassette subfamily B protein
VFGLVTIMSTLLVTVGVVAVLLSVAPILLPVAVLGYVPIALVNIRNTRARYQLEHSQTELLRERSYLEYLMTDRVEAKEIRAYDVAPTLRRWHAALWDTRMTKLRALVRRRLALTTGPFVTTAVLIATLSPRRQCG